MLGNSLKDFSVNVVLTYYGAVVLLKLQFPEPLDNVGNTPLVDIWLAGVEGIIFSARHCGPLARVHPLVQPNSSGLPEEDRAAS